MIERWLAAFARSRLRLPRLLDAREFQALARSVVEPLAHGLSEPDAEPGASCLREAEKAFAFAGGAFGMNGASAFDVAAFTTSLRDVLSDEARDVPEREALARLFDWFSALAVESFSTSVREALRLHHRETLERGTPVVMITPELPAAFLVGEPDRSVIEATFGRVLLAVVRVGARAVILDGGGLTRPDAAELIEAMERFASHRKIAGKVTLVMTGLAEAQQRDWIKALETSVTVVHEERFEDAVVRALAVGGHEIVRRRDAASNA